ncbi:MAG: glycosyltransferase [Verrucomicrobiota bacterium]
MESEHLVRVIRHPCIEGLPLGCRDYHCPDYVKARQTLGWSEERIILFLSRIDVKKGLDLLFPAMANGGFDWQGWRLVVVGDGDPKYLTSLKTSAAEAAARLPKVEWIGPVWGAARWPYIQGADLFCLPTHSENFGLAVLEALHAGTPVMTTDQTPWAHYTGLDGLFIAKPDVSSLQKNISLARLRIGDKWSPENRQQLAIWAENNFAWNRLAPAYIRAYQRAGEKSKK